MDKRELKEEIDAASTINHSNLLHYTKEGMSWRNDNIVINKGKLFDLIDQLDEPEVLSTDWIKDNQSMWTSIHGAEYYVPANKLYGKLVPKQEEAEKVVVPDFVDRWLKRSKGHFESIYRAIGYLSSYGYDDYDDDGDDYKVYEWLPGNEEVFVLAWNHGSTVEEKKYEVKDKHGCFILIKNLDGEVINAYSKVVYKNNGQLTEQEIKDYDERYWPFAVPVEEVSE